MVWIRMSPICKIFEFLVTSWWAIRRGLGPEVFLEQISPWRRCFIRVGFQVSKVHATPLSLSLPSFFHRSLPLSLPHSLIPEDWGAKYLNTSPKPWQPVCCYVLCHDAKGLSLWIKCKAQLNALLCKSGLGHRVSSPQ